MKLIDSPDPDMKFIGTFRTLPHKGAAGDMGFIEVPFSIPLSFIVTSGSPASFIRKEIGLACASLCLEYEMPKEMWNIEIHPEIRKLANLPPLINFVDGV
jgi:hypothetical protein